MEQKNKMLSLAGYINLLIAFGHIIGLIWADQMFRVIGISNEMNKLSLIHYSLPYLLTIIVSGFFLLFGLYGLSADNKFRKLPFQKIVIFMIAGIYLFRGLGEIFSNSEKNDTNPFIETSYSLIALMIGLLFLIGGLKKWQFATKEK
jgi:nitrate reductase gamma subunit